MTFNLFKISISRPALLLQGTKVPLLGGEPGSRNARLSRIQRGYIASRLRIYLLYVFISLQYINCLTLLEKLCRAAILFASSEMQVQMLCCRGDASKALAVLEGVTQTRRRMSVQLTDPYHTEVKAEPSYPPNTKRLSCRGVWLFVLHTSEDTSTCWKITGA